MTGFQRGASTINRKSGLKWAARRELARVESNHIGLRTCEAILQLLGGQFFTHRTGDDFSAEFVLPRTPPDAAQG